MGESTKIAWTDHTFNPWWGCQRVSPGCEHCYAETFSKRVGLKLWGPTTERRFFGDKHWNEPLKWNATAERAQKSDLVFCASMSDVFEKREELIVHRARLRKMVDSTPWLNYQLLTKRPHNAEPLWAQAQYDSFNGADSLGPLWQPNVWLGTTVEDCGRRDERIPHLFRSGAKTKFLSMEPLLEKVSIADYLVDGGPDWVIVGGESGPGARPFDLRWAELVLEECRAASVAFFMKQMGSKPTLDGGPVRFIGKGDDPDEWPPHLRVQEFPSLHEDPSRERE
jgi:protein gp37